MQPLESPTAEPCFGKTIERPLEPLKPYPNNPRIHSTKQLETLKISIRKFGFRIPVLIEDDGVRK